MHHGLLCQFYKNRLTFVVSYPNILFWSFFAIFFWIFQSHWFICSFYFGTFTIILCIFFLNYRCVVSWRGEQCGATKFMCGCWSWLGWDSINFRFQLSNSLGERCGIAKFMCSCWNRLGWNSINFKWWFPNASFACRRSESISCDFQSIVRIFLSHLTTFMGRINICWVLFSLTWKIFIHPDTVFPPLLNTIPLIGLNVLIQIIQDFLKCYFWNVVVPTNPLFVIMQNLKFKK
jgi:hypothetical protein